MKNKMWIWLIVSILVVLLDQWSKYMVNSHFTPGVSFYLLPFLNFTLSYNTGAAFSFLNAGGWLTYALILFSFIVSVILLFWILRLNNQQKWLAFSLSLILGGAIGNLIDRAKQHYVTDFIDFHIHGWHFAVFNVADSAVTVGVILLLIKWFFLAE